MERVAGIDVSRWQGKIDWTKVAAAGYHYAIIRATIGDDYTDPRFLENWHGAQNAGLLVSAYHVIAPKAAAERQIAHFFAVLGNLKADLPLCMDVEREDGTALETITRCVKACLLNTEDRDQRKPIIYTARWFWDRYVLPAPEWRTYDLWVASYTSSAILPRDWKSWRFWQYSESGAVPGSGSRATDLNWFAGSYADLVEYSGKKAEPEEEAEEEGEEEAEAEVETETEADKIEAGSPWQIRVLDKVNVRTGPGTSFEDVGDLYAGDVIEVQALAGNDVWVEFEPGRWAAFARKGEIYMELSK
jgi:GH25 family lysozyme M1 (1,4-beta-N-acetylmuramidase)